jgi:predicted ATPase
MATPAPAVPRLTYLRIKNYRALRDVEFRDLTPLTVLIGPNGSGKSTVLDALDFLAEAVRGDLQKAWSDRNGFRGMRTRGSEGNIEFEVKLLVTPSEELRYSLELNYESEKKILIRETLSLKTSGIEQVVLKILPSSEEGWTDFESPWATENLNDIEIEKPTDKISISSAQRVMLGYAFAVNRRLSPYSHAVIDTLTSYRLLHLTDDHLKGYSDAGPREKLSPNGDNLPNVLYHLHERHPEVLAKITAQMRRWVPGLADIVPEITSDERLLLRFKDAPFEKPLPAQYMSGGTMRLAALLTLLYEPGATGLLGIEEPENELHPQLLPQLAEELIAASENRQLLVATHAPFLLDALEPSQVWILHRDAQGYTQATRAADIPGVPELVEDGSPLGYLWTSNSLPVGNPLSPPANAR